MESFVAQIMLFGGNFAPRGWAFCDGQLLPISSHPALFSLLGTAYGGDGKTTFALPDLRGRVPMHAGSGPDLTPRKIGQKVGQETVHLTVAEMPEHNHDLNIADTRADNDDPEDGLIGRSRVFSKTATSTTALLPQTISTNGTDQPHENMQPTLCINYIIALEGIYPSRH